MNQLADENGHFQFDAQRLKKYQLLITAVGFKRKVLAIHTQANATTELQVKLDAEIGAFEEVVVTGAFNEVSRMASPVPVEIYSPSFFKRNPTPNVFEALQNINGIRPQINCNVCNTGDIHINGLEGPYTMVLIDGMPLVSGLSTVYGLSGIPNALIERIEVIKGPASSLYGSEAVGGLINIITKKPEKANKISIDLFHTSWQETNLDVVFKTPIFEKGTLLTGINYFRYQNPMDKNGDNFTDVTLQHRISIFEKWQQEYKKGKWASLAARYFYEDRWGGEMTWEPLYRGTDLAYGESIYTSRAELIGSFDLPSAVTRKLQYSFNQHRQNSFYGLMPFMAIQRIGFAQLTQNSLTGKHDLLSGISMRYIYYDDNTAATQSVLEPERSQPQHDLIPGIFLQDQWKVSSRDELLLGYRFDYHPEHKGIHTPRLAYKHSITPFQTLRLNAGTGFRVVNLFTEDHAALTGAREVIIQEKLKPEKSYNLNLNYMAKIVTGNEGFIGLDLSAFYTYFTNRITPDYETDPQKIIYKNLKGFAVSKGISANIDLNFNSGLILTTGATLMDNKITENGVSRTPLLTERFSGTWSLSYPILKKYTLDYTGNVYSPMKLPLLGNLDPRPAESPWWSIQNVQLTFKSVQFEWYGGIKNLLNFRPPANSIARPFDPFDKNVSYNSRGEVIADAGNPYALTFDPSYVFAPNQGIRFFMGVRLRVE